jgi:hypothetical protein
MRTATQHIHRFAIAMLAIVGAVATTGCHDIEEYSEDRAGVFEQLWTVLDEHYCFFAEKEQMYRDEYAQTPADERDAVAWKANWSWDDVHTRYSKMISPTMTEQELFQVCGDMLNELKDGHTNLSSTFGTSYYRQWWSDYPQNYNARVIEESYFNFNYRSSGGIIYDVLPENIGYMHYSSFSYSIGEGNLDAILAYFAPCAGMIIDVRDNGGGSITNVEKLVGRFTDTSFLAGSICHKTGAGHSDFSEPYDFYINPQGGGHLLWNKPVVVLCNRSTYSAANNFVSIMKELPNVTIVGATTGGGSGMPFSSELSNGWGVRFSASPIRNSKGELTEFGVTPTSGCEVDLDEEAVLNGRDTMIDFAVRRLLGQN